MDAIADATPSRPGGSKSTLTLEQADFERFRRLIQEHTGIYLAPHKIDLVRGRLFKRVQNLGLRSFRAYYDLVCDPDRGASELVWMIDAITTNKTEFFRETAHFEYLRETFFPRWRSRPVIRILSAGCSSGEEPYSIAMVAHEVLGPQASQQVQITAVDLSTRILERAKNAIYPFDAVRTMPQHRLHRFFLKGSGSYRDLVQVKPEIRSMVHFERRNILRDLDFSHAFHGVFCCNVTIYFERATQAELFERLYDCIAPGGNLFVGHSESMIFFPHRFQYLQPSLYERSKPVVSPPGRR